MLEVSVDHTALEEQRALDRLEREGPLAVVALDAHDRLAEVDLDARLELAERVDGREEAVGRDLGPARSAMQMRSANARDDGVGDEIATADEGETLGDDRRTAAGDEHRGGRLARRAARPA